MDGVETRYLVDTTRPYAQVLEEYTIDGTTRQTQVSYTYGLDLLSQDRGSDDLFYLEDGHSGVRQLSDESGLITDTYSYDAYGNLIAATGGSENNYLYRGEQFDPNADLQYLRARYYDPSTGRFPSVDPFEGRLEEPMTRHRYLYANANPVMFVDPSGMVTQLVLGGPVLGGILSSLPTAHIFGVLATTAGGIGIASAITYVKNRFKKKLEWEGSLEFASLSSPLGGLGGFSVYLPNRR